MALNSVCAQEMTSRPSTAAVKPSDIAPPRLQRGRSQSSEDARSAARPSTAAHAHGDDEKDKPAARVQVVCRFRPENEEELKKVRCCVVLLFMCVCAAGPLCCHLPDRHVILFFRV